MDLGAGRGWPGLYLTARTGCRVVLADLPLEGLQVAAVSGLPFHSAGMLAGIDAGLLRRALVVARRT